MLIDKKKKRSIEAVKANFFRVYFFSKSRSGTLAFETKKKLTREWSVWLLFPVSNSACPRFASGVGLGNNDFWMVIYEFPVGDFVLKFRWRKQ